MAVKKSKLTFEEIVTRAKAMMDGRADGILLNTDEEDAYTLTLNSKDKISDPSDPNGIRELLDTTAFDVVNAATRILSTDAFQISLPPVAPADKTKKETADRIEQTLKRMVDMSDAQTRYPIVKQIVGQLAIFSITVPKTIDHRSNRMGKGASAGKTLLNFPTNISPITFEVVHPSNAAWAIGGLGLYRFVESCEKPPSEILSIYGDKLTKDIEQTDADETIEYNDYWDLDIIEGTGTRCVWSGDIQIVPPVEHGLTFFPITVRFGEGLSFLTKPEFRQMSLLYGLLKSRTLARSHQLLTIQMTNIARYAVHPKMVVKTRDGRDVVINMGSDEAVKLYAEEEIFPLVAKMTPPEMLQLMARIDSQRSRTTLNDVTFGTAPGGVTTAFGLDILNRGGKLPIYPIQNAANLAMSDMLNAVLGWIEEKGQSLDLGNGLTISVEESKEYRNNINVKLTANLPQDVIGKAQMFMQLVDKHYMPLAKLWDAIGETNSKDLEQGIVDDIIFQKRIEQETAERMKEVGVKEDKLVDPNAPPKLNKTAQTTSQVPVPQELLAQAQQQAQGGQQQGAPNVNTPAQAVVPPPVQQ